MKNRLLIIIALFIFSSSNIFFPQDKTYKTIKPTISITKMSKQKAPVKLYIDIFNAKQYINYLISNSLLEISQEYFYSTTLVDKKQKWLVLLYLSEKPEDGIIMDSFDYPLKYVFLLDKNNGKISDFYKIF